MALITTDRLRILPFELDDWNPFLALSTDPEVVLQIGNGEVWSVERARKWLTRQGRLQEKWGYSR